MTILSKLSVPKTLKVDEKSLSANLQLFSTINKKIGFVKLGLGDELRSEMQKNSCHFNQNVDFDLTAFRPRNFVANRPNICIYLKRANSAVTFLLRESFVLTASTSFRGTLIAFAAYNYSYSHD